MNKNAPQILRLRADVEKQYGQHVLTPSDFEALATDIWQRIHQQLSPTTLKRLWGYIAGAPTIRHSTLNVLSNYIGFTDWETYLTHLSSTSDIESNILTANNINVNTLTPGNIVEVTWQPNRLCRFCYQGNNSFIVTHSENAKLVEGATFTTAFFILGEPLYIDNLCQGTLQNGSYVAGSHNGLSSIKKF